MTDFAYDKGKFRELVLYVSQKCEGDERFGDTRLNKILFFSDAFALQTLGQPITGARYQKLEFGPAPRALVPLRREMEADGDLEVRLDDKRRVTVALRGADMSAFSKPEIDVIDAVIGSFEGRSAQLVSDLSHAISPGWNLVEENEDIPLESQMISRKAPPERVLARGRKLAEQHGW